MKLREVHARLSQEIEQRIHGASSLLCMGDVSDTIPKSVSVSATSHVAHQMDLVCLLWRPLLSTIDDRVVQDR